jgi:hypothetical protein
MPVESDADLLGMFDAADFGIASTWSPGWDRDWPRSVLIDLEAESYVRSVEETGIVVMRDDQRQVAAGFAASGTIAPRFEVMLPLPALSAEILRGDLLRVGGELLVVEASTSDIEARIWRITLSDA